MCCCKWNQIGVTVTAFGLGILAAKLCPTVLLLPLSALILVAAGLALIL